MSNRNRKPILLSAILSLLLFTVACELDSIQKIKSDPYRYQDKDARVGGIVRRHYAALNYGVYEIEDQTGRIWVVSRNGAPAEGARVEVKGRTRTAFSLPGFDLGSVLIEKKRKIHR